MKILKKQKVDFLPTMLFILSAIIWRTPYYVLGLYVFIPIVIGISFWKYNKYIISSKYWKPSIILLLWMFLSSVLSRNYSESMSAIIPCIAAVFLSLSVWALVSINDNSKLVEFAYIALFFSILYATVTGDFFTLDFNYANEAERRGNTQLNSNQYAYFSLFALIATRLILGKQKVKNSIIRILIYLGLGSITFFIALLTASRQVLLLGLPVLLYFLYYDFWLHGNNKVRIFSIALLIIIGVFCLPTILEVYNSSYLSTRVSANIQEDSRVFLLKTGLEQGLNHPILGLGLGADVIFSHCTYTHLMARCGMIAFLAYIYIILIALIEQFTRYKQTKDTYFKLYAFLIIIFTIANFFYSYINQPFMLSVLFVIIGDSDKTYRNIIGIV